MRRFIYGSLLLLLLVFVIFLAARYDHGYVLIVYPPWRVELSFVLALAMTVGVFLLGYLVMRFVQIALKLPGDVRAWKERRRRARDQVELSRIVGALLSGQPAHARQLADKLLDGKPNPLVSLLAARAALDVGDALSARRFLAQVDSQEGEMIAARQTLQSQLPALPASATVP
jgi:HemY protein